jgi:CHASE3 domain sensor protein
MILRKLSSSFVLISGTVLVLLAISGTTQNKPSKNREYIVNQQDVLRESDSLNYELDTIRCTHKEVQRVLRDAMYMKDPE